MPNDKMDVIEILRLHRLGKSVREISQITGTKENSVRAFINSHGESVNAMPSELRAKLPNRLTEEELQLRQLVIKLYMEGGHPKHITELTQLPYYVVTRTIYVNLTDEQKEEAKQIRNNYRSGIMYDNVVVLHKQGYGQYEIAIHLAIPIETVYDCLVSWRKTSNR